MWVIVVVPPAFGFWLVAGDLAGVPPGEQRSLLFAALFSLGLATLLQALAGHRLAVFEGPASTYLAAIAVLGASSAGGSPQAVTAGLLMAGLLVLLLGLLRADRMLRHLFTPPVVATFMLIIVLAVVPATLERVIGRSGSHPWGVAAAWGGAAAVALGWLGARALPALRPYALLPALVLGTLVYFLIAGVPTGPVRGGIAVPELLPWGAPHFSAPVIAPFLVAGLLSAFNTVASVNVMSEAVGRPADPSAQRRGLLGHGGSQLVTACFGNVLGNVPRLDSVGVVRMLGNDRPQALALAAVAILALAFVAPAVDALALIPVAVSAALLALVLGILALEGLRQSARLSATRRWLVVAPAVAPTAVWLLVGDRFSEFAQLVANPLLIGVVLAVVLDRVIARPDVRHRPPETGDHR